MQIDISVKFARVLGVPVSFKDAGIANINDTYRGQILTGDNEIRDAVIKVLDRSELASELICSSLGKSLALPVPDAYLAISAENQIPTTKAPLLNDNSLVFASIDVRTPAISQYIIDSSGLKPDVLKAIAAAICANELLGPAYSFDAWTANVDRHPGNILYGPNSEFWLIDHGNCFTGSNWEIADLHAATSFRNRLKEWLTPNLQPNERSNCKVHADTKTEILKVIGDATISNNDVLLELLGVERLEALYQFLKRRITHVPRLTADALGLVV